MSRIVEPENTGAAMAEATNNQRREGRSMSFSALMPRLVGKRIWVWTLSFNFIGEVVDCYGDFIELKDCVVVFDHSATGIDASEKAGATQFQNIQHITAFALAQDVEWAKS